MPVSTTPYSPETIKPITRPEVRRALGVAEEDGAGDVDDQTPSDEVKSTYLSDRPHVDQHDDQSDDLAETSKWLERLAHEELESIDSEPEVVWNRLSPPSQTNGIPIFLEDDSSHSADNMRVFMEPSNLGMNTEVLTWIGFGLGPRPVKRVDILRPLHAPGIPDNEDSEKELSPDDPPETFDELLQALKQWNDHVLVGQPLPDTGHLEEGAWKNTVLGLMEQARLEAPHHYETEKASLKARITAAMQVKNRAEVERLEVLKRRLNHKRFLECKAKVLRLIKAEYQKTKEPILKELEELKVQRAALHYLLAERSGHTIPPLLEFMKICEKADREVQQAMENAGNTRPDGQIVQVAVDAMADLSEEGLQKTLDLSMTEVGSLQLEEGRATQHLKDIRIMADVRTANQDIKDMAALVHQQLSGWEGSLKDTYEAGQKQYEAYSNAYARVNGSPGDTEPDDDATSSYWTEPGPLYSSG